MSKRTTKRALAMSFVSVLLCVCMLVGTTFAWFTDSVTSNDNIIQSGTLDVAMSWADGKTDPTNTAWTDAAAGAIFNYDKWEPGYVDVKHIKIENKGTLALKYQLNIVADGEVSELANVIDVYFVDGGMQVTDRTALVDSAKVGTLNQILAYMPGNASGDLGAGASNIVTIALKMQESAGNEYQNKSIGTSFSVQLLATQDTVETDSFDDQYDKDAEYPVSPVTVSSVTEFNTALQEGKPVELSQDITLTEDIAVTSGSTVTIDLAGKELNAGEKTLTVENGGTLNINNSSDAESSLVVTENSYAGIIQDGGTVNINNVDIVVGGDMVGISIADGITTMNGGKIIVNGDATNPGIGVQVFGSHSEAATFIMNGGEIVVTNGNEANVGIDVSLLSVVTLNDGKITANAGSAINVGYGGTYSTLTIGSDFEIVTSGSAVAIADPFDYINNGMTFTDNRP